MLLFSAHQCHVLGGWYSEAFVFDFVATLLGDPLEVDLVRPVPSARFREDGLVETADEGVEAAGDEDKEAKRAGEGGNAKRGEK